MLIHEIKDALNEIAPLETQAEWDNSGVQICYGPKDIKTIIVAMEMTDELITEAIENKADMIITHHPLIFDPIKSIHCCTPQGRFIKRLIQNEIVLYSSHTPFDISKGGNTDHLMKLMGVTKVKVVPGTEEFLKAGVLAKETTLADFAYMLAEKLDLPGLKFTGDPEKKIKTVAACTGGGGEFVKDAVGFDLYVTGDVKYHDAQFALESGLAVIDAGHWGTEQIFVPNMAAQLRQKLGSKVTVIESKLNQDPFSFMV